MKTIVIPADRNKVSPHFGHCQQFCIVKTDGKEVVEKEFTPNPGHEPGFLPRFLRDLGAECILAGGMGRRAVNLFNENGIEVITGVSGTVETVITRYLDGSLETDANICDH